MTDLFNEKAKDWDGREMIRALSKAVGSAITEKVSLHSAMQAMDFGAGTGLVSGYIAPFVNNITAVDISAAMLKELAAKPAFQGKITVVCQDMITHPLQQSFDFIFSAMAMHHVKDTSLLIQRFAEHLHAGGTVALADLDFEDGSFHPKDVKGLYHTGFKREQLQTIMEQHGFIDIQWSTAHIIEKEGKKYPVFLLIASKAA